MMYTEVLRIIHTHTHTHTHAHTHTHTCTHTHTHTHTRTHDRYVVPFDRDVPVDSTSQHHPQTPRYLVAGASQENHDVWQPAPNMTRALELVEHELVAIYPPLRPAAGMWSPSHARAVWCLTHDEWVMSNEWNG